MSVDGYRMALVIMCSSKILSYRYVANEVADDCSQGTLRVTIIPYMVQKATLSVSHPVTNHWV